MLKKEWRDIFLPVLLRLSLGPLLAVIQAIFAGKVDETTFLLFFIGFVISVFWAALHMGLSTFHSEFRDHAFEYLFTFPFKRSRLLLNKFAARLLILGSLFILYYLLLQGVWKLLPPMPRNLSHNSPIFNAFDFSMMALSFFVIGFFLSLVDWGSARPAIPLMILVSQVLLTLLIRKPLHRLVGTTNLNDIISNVLLIIFTGIYFLFCFRRLGCGTLGNKWRKSSKKSLPLVVCQKNGRNWGLLRHETWIVARSFIFAALFIPVLGFLSGHVRITFDGGQQRLLDPVVAYATIAAFLILFFAFYSGSGSFYSEFRRKALEYLLTFPLSLRRILTDKLLARILVLIPAVIAYMIFAGHFSERLALGSEFLYYFLRPAYFPFWVALMLFNGFFLSLFEMKNMMALVSLANFYTVVFVPLAVAGIIKRFSIDPQAMTVLIYGSGLLLTTLILASAFFKLVNRFDLAAPNRFSRVFGLFLFTVFTSVSLASLAIVLFI